MPSPCGYDLGDSDLIQVQENVHFESREQPHVFRGVAQTTNALLTFCQ